MGNAWRIQAKGTADAEMRQLDFGQRPIKFHDGFQQIDTFRNGIFDPITNKSFQKFFVILILQKYLLYAKIILAGI